MRIGSAHAQDEPEISLVPLIDVILTLIIFFVITTTFQERSAMKIALPQQAAQNEAAQMPKDPLTVVIDGEGRTFVGGGEVPQRDVAAIRDAIAAVAGEDKNRAVILRADAKTPHQAVVTAMDAIGQLGFSRLSIATTPAEAAK